jgi:ADP-dependent phosphofructokinase/glucokinase
MASTRYAYGDDFSEDDYNEVAQAPPSSAGAAFARAIEARMPGLVRCSPAVVMQTARPTMIGLGDSFVGGFLAAGRKP